jgi:hypothetical protein
MPNMNTTMVYLVPPVPTQEPSWRLRVDGPQGGTDSFQISDEVAKIFVDAWVPVVRLGTTPTGASQGSLILAINELSHQSIQVSDRLINAMEVALLVEPTHEVRILINCPTELETIHWVNTVTQLRHQVGCISVSMGPIQDTLDTCSDSTKPLG